ncbi:MAG: ABC transporter permease [Blastocatellia bacterium]
MSTLWQDLRYGARMLSKKPGFTLIAVVTLALGIGANTALFSVVNAVLLSPLPFRDAERLVAVGQNSPRNRAALSSASHRNFVEWRAQNKVFEEMAAYYGGVYTLTGQGEAVRLRGAVVTHGLFNVLNAAPLLGRAFLPDDDKAGGGDAGRPAILSWDCWRQYFGGDANIVGRAIKLNGAGYVVVGVMPAGFAFPIEAQPTEIWTSTARDAENTNIGSILVSRGYLVWSAIARLKPGVSLAQAQAEMNVIANALAAQYPEFNRDTGITVAPLLDSLVSNVRLTLLLLLGAVGCVLLVACVNVANLLLERAIARRKEITIRLALGASRWRIARQLLTESVVLSVLSGAVGLLFAWWGKDLLVALSPDGIARIAETRLDARVMAFTALVSLLTGALFGSAPALAAVNVSLSESLKDGGRGATAGARLGGARGLLVVFEIALALVLLVGGGLLVRSLARLQRVDLGFNTENVLTFGVTVSGEALGENSTPRRRADFFRQVEERLKALPGVTGASVTSSLPLSGGAARTGLRIEGRAQEPGREPMGVVHIVGDDYFRTMGVPLRQGREFTARDDLNAPPVLIVNETLAKRLFPNEDPLGKRIEPSYSAVGPTRMREIVGVVGDTKHTGPRDRLEPEIYFALGQMPMETMAVAIRGAGDPRGLSNAARDTLRALNRNAPVFRFRTLDEYFARTIAPARFNTLLIGLFAVVALVITMVGLYGVISCAVSQSVHEFGVRMALGAQAGDILRLVLKQGMALALAGVALGAVGAFALTRWLADLLYGVSATDPMTFIVIALLLVAAALLACWIPARRATKVDPIVALRCE